MLRLSPLLTAGQRAFQIATHLALAGHADLIDDLVAEADLSGPEARALARIGLANYFAGALILPYGAFRSAAEELRYDIDLLQRRFRVGFETVAHRLSTLQRPGARGVPFFFVRVDRAGNISKRQSATDFHFSRVGGSCPLWNVYEAFAHPGEIRTQLAQMPDGRAYLWVARTVTRRYGGFGTPAKTFAIGLGCDLHHAHRLVYADGLDLASPGGADADRARLQGLRPFGLPAAGVPGDRQAARGDRPPQRVHAVPLDILTRWSGFGCRIRLSNGSRGMQAGRGPVPGPRPPSFDWTAVTRSELREGPARTDPVLARWRNAVFAVFALSGFVFANWAARVPNIRDILGATTQEMGVLILGLAIGAMVGLVASGHVIAHLGATAAIRWFLASPRSA